jgi:GNAT superfamily N-acetyltransferase
MLASARASRYSAHAMDSALRPDDLAPGDRGVASQDWSDVRVQRVAGADDPGFALGYQQLWAEFGARGEMERRAVIAERLAWDPARPVGRARLAYELLLLWRGAELAALRDHTAVVRIDASGAPLPGPLVVHLSHALIEPAHRGSGLAAWLRALPLAAARRCAAAARCTPGTPIVLVAEMEPLTPEHPERRPRLRSYERAGFLKVDPAAARYAQPDFRPPELLAGATPTPVPLELVLRRVGRERERALPAAELAAIVESIYAVYAAHVPEVALGPLRRGAAQWTAQRASFHLVSPLGP